MLVIIIQFSFMVYFEHRDDFEGCQETMSGVVSCQVYMSLLTKSRFHVTSESPEFITKQDGRLTEN